MEDESRTDVTPMYAPCVASMMFCPCRVLYSCLSDGLRSDDSRSSVGVSHHGMCSVNDSSDVLVRPSTGVPYLKLYNYLLRRQGSHSSACECR